MSTFGPAYDEAKDGKRIMTQMEAIKRFMLGCGWLTLKEIENALGYPQASISANLRHLRKEQFGGYDVQKRRRKPDGGLWEYKVTKVKVGDQAGLF